jgi:hypothetical protein
MLDLLLLAMLPRFRVLYELLPGLAGLSPMMTAQVALLTPALMVRVPSSAA